MLRRWDQHEKSDGSGDETGAGSDISFDPIADVLNEIETDQVRSKPTVERFNAEVAIGNTVEVGGFDDDSNSVSEISYKPWESLVNENRQDIDDVDDDDFSVADSDDSPDVIDEMIDRMDCEESSNSESAVSALSEV